MNIVPDKVTLVIAGAFNPAILSPPWVLINVLKHNDVTIPVELRSPIDGSGPTTFTLQGFSFTPSNQRLIVHLGDLNEAEASRCVSYVAQILELLPHTPISGLGFNFGYRSETPSDSALSMFRTNANVLNALGEDAEVVASSWGSSITVDEELLGITSKLIGGSLELNVNFHTSSVSVASMIELLRHTDAFSSRLEKANMIATIFNA